MFSRSLSPAGPSRPPWGARLLAACVALTAAGCGGNTVEHSVPKLVVTLKEDADPNMRYWAAESLGHFGAEAAPAVPDLTRTLQEDGSAIVRMGAAYALAEIGPAARAAEPALTGALKDPDAEVRKAAAYAVRRLRGAKR
jgi:hypothetical protein